MRRVALSLLLCALALPASAAGVALRWGSCEGYANRNFACDRSTGNEVLVGSFSPPPGITALTGIEVYMRITTADGRIPAWWQMVTPGSCRQGSLSTSFVVSDEAECDDPWQGQGMGGIARYKLDGSNGVDLWVAVAVAPNFAQPMSAGRTYAAFKLLLNHQRSAGAGSCEGCSTPACISIERMVLAQPRGYRDYEITTPIPGMGTGASNVATWQGGTPNCGAGAPKPSSWSDVKKIFH